MQRWIAVGFTGSAGVAVGLALGLATPLVDPDDRHVLWREMANVRLPCSVFGEVRRVGGDRWTAEDAESCVPVAGEELRPGRVLTRDDLDGVWLPRDYLVEGVVDRDPVGRVVARRVLPGEWLREERLTPGTP